jgi:hypothetical protein
LAGDDQAGLFARLPGKQFEKEFHGEDPCRKLLEKEIRLLTWRGRG